jgi:PKD repeat protein
MSDIVRLDDGSYRMYYGIFINPPEGRVTSGINSATSPDGFNWTVDAGHRLLGDGDGDDGPDGIPSDEGVISGPRVVRLSDGTFRMYYQASTQNVVSPPDFRVKSATSSDGIAWTREGTRIDINYPYGGPDQFSLAGHSYILRFADDDYMIFISANDNTTWNQPSDLVIGTSKDGLTFNNFSTLYKRGHDPFIVKSADGSGYWLFYGNLLERQRSAFSVDGKNWPSQEETTETVLLNSNGEEVTEASTVGAGDRSALALPSGEILLYLNWGSPSPSIGLMRQQTSFTPVASFTGKPITGSAPLEVSFTDTSTGEPTDWAWYFGDETLTGTWTEVTDHAGWEEREGHTTVVLPDGSIIVMGGMDETGNLKNDVWRSTDKGASWTRVNESAGWSDRSEHTSVVLSDGSILLMGGMDSSWQYKRDVWRSTDKGSSWVEVTSNAPWFERAGHSSVVLPDGSIVLMGGRSNVPVNDTWRSTDNGATWTSMSVRGDWQARDGQSSIVLPDGSIILMGGFGVEGDVWRSSDYGATWTLVTANPEWTRRAIHGSVVLPDGSILLIGGFDQTENHEKNDIWRSTDNGTTWTCITTDAPWRARDRPGCVVLPDGNLVIMGGYTSQEPGWEGGTVNDVWRLRTAGSSVQHPSHTYTQSGVYQVALQASNSYGYNNVRKAGYITVTGGGLPVANFTANRTEGFAPLAVAFTDTSTGNPTSWLWTFGDGTTATEQHPEKIYTYPANYSVSLTISGTAGNDSRIETNYISVHLRADFNRNNRIDIGDVAKVAYMAAGLVPEDPEADFDGDGHVTGADAARIAYFYVGKIQTL